MKKIILITSLVFFSSCLKQKSSRLVDNHFMSENEMELSKNNSKNLNDLERKQILDWINLQDEKYFPMGMNYWVNIENLDKQSRKKDGEIVSYKYDIYDFNRTKICDSSLQKINMKLGHFVEIDALADVIRYLKKNEEAEILVPSLSGYGSQGDGKKIKNDLPIIVKVKIL